MFNYLSSYLVGSVQDKQAEQAAELNNKREELRQYDE
jgi:hypothetical protein